MTRTRIIFAGFGCLALAAGISAGIFYHTVFATFNIDETDYVYVRPSTTEIEIKSQLRDICHLNSLLGWIILSKAFPFTPHTGRYAVEPTDNLLSVYRRLRRGQQAPVRLTIPSVRRLSRLAGVLAHNLMLDSAEVAAAFADSAVAADYGYTLATLPSLFIPNTYEVYWDVSFDILMQRMRREHDSFWQADDREQKAETMGLTNEQVATLASIVDEETNYGPERSRIAGLYLNRLRLGMPLQADPTVKFAVGNDSLRRILNTHLHTPSPYNTYINKGLPPGPIRIPTIASIDAVLNAENNEFLYFCAKEDFSGSHNFARTYSEHLANARRYQLALNQRGIRN
ncbi:MAG: endolytic transglycosylase MltG [Bacteroidaceae bacterium]|nr:endolytic transglycosylase MltG [Bacteroidaceae bacterium]